MKNEEELSEFLKAQKKIVEESAKLIEKLSEDWDKLRSSFLSSLENLSTTNLSLISLGRDLKDLIQKLKFEYEWKLVEEEVIHALEIRDTLWYESKLVHLGISDACTVYIVNELDKDLNVQVYGNRTKTTLNAVKIGDLITAPANDITAINLNVYTNVWTPWSFVKIQAVAPPTKGVVHITYLRRTMQ